MNRLQRVKNLVDRLLVANVFLVMGGALWFLVAVVALNQGLEEPLTVFQRLWQPLFMPAIGLLLATALLSGLAGWLKTALKRRGPTAGD